jgi:TolB-like protein/Tfp pilus assembly protein PilF
LPTFLQGLTPMGGTTDFFRELRRRNVFKVGAAYAIVSWLILQFASTTFPALQLPGWAFTLVTVLIFIGFPFSLLFAWAFELTPEGVKPTRKVAPEASITPQTGSKLNRIVIALLVLAVVVLLLRDYWRAPEALPEKGPDTISVAAQTGKVSADKENVSGPFSQNPDRHSIAVLPFANRSRSEDDAFFVDGVHDDLLTQLSKIHALRVISRTSVENYRGTGKPLPVIAAELGVGTVMEGSVQRSGERIRINVQLIDAATDEHLWAEIYDRELTAANIFDIQSEIATAIAKALQAELTSDDAQRLAVQPTQNLAAYEAYLLGRQRFAMRTAKGLREAVDYFQQAIALDAEFGLAYVSLADVYQVQGDWGLISLKEANVKSLPLAEKALQLDDQSGEAYTTLGSIREYAGDLEGAGQAYRHALELAPNYAQASFWYGLYLMQSMGLPADAIPRLEHALTLDPLSGIVMANLATAHMALGDFATALAVIQKSLEVDPAFGSALGNKGWFAWTVKGDLVTAIDFVLQAYAADPDDQWNIASLAELFSELGDDSTAACALETSSLVQDAPYSSVQNALMAVYGGDGSAAESYARTALANTWIRFNKALPLAIVRAQLQRNGQPDQALALYQQHFPELLETPLPELTLNNSRAAIDLASLLQAMDREAEARQLLDGSERYIQNQPRLGEWGYRVDDARIQVLRGEKEHALAALRTAVDSSWRLYWRYDLEHDPILEPLRSDPRFQAIVQEIRADMAAQLEQVRSKGYGQGICTVPVSP